MVGPKMCSAALVAAMLSLGTSNVEACNCLSRWFGGCGCATTASYAPYVAAYAPACGTCAVPQVVNYVPQTAYRTVYVNMPVVSYQPVPSYNRLTGCSTTVMRPVTSYVTTARVVPYMSYRPVVTAAYAPVAAPAVAAAYYAPAAPAAAAPCCGAAAYAPAPAAAVPSGAVGTPVPSLGPPPGYSPAPVPGAAPQGPYAPGLAPSSPPTTPPSPSLPDEAAPDGSSPNNSSPNKTFNDSPEGQPAQPQSRLMQPPPNFNNSSTMGAPRALDPEDQDRSTALPLNRTLAARPVSVTTPVEDANEGWRPSSR